MSAPDTNLTREKRRHRPAVWGIALAVAFGLGMLFAIMLQGTDGETPPAGTAATAPASATAD
ncbi:hypothetical protein SAMN06297129_2856 [Pseudooceanicola antarcticus]|uniref:Uncharacterized protein n=1 Tax=Pseudooceanicola antarcticus TaxID=1247613 RepID=A0A285J2Y9_9RHOB|nr:hypothetical protein [Pseudooceanicola antarcticus]PJE29746.1 hypothetical protein CVM39_07525 [Pseudooceanicola antarcticus]SNY54572.1 hypothetical protein SAMN06297129_2856 [Pseudooceanicola antarcticus]